MSADSEPWYRGVTRYQWLVLFLASLGWVFDVFEGQIFVASMNEAMPDLLPAGAEPGEIAFYNNVTFAAFLIGGALGGVVFGVLADRFGRVRAMNWTILVYSVFTSVSALAGAWWQLAILRFLVALGVGGEWAVASAFVAEVFPRRSRAWTQSIFHASSVLGTFLAVAAGTFVVGNPHFALSFTLFGIAVDVTGWRLGFLLGALPALLIIWIRASLREPERWQEATGAKGRVGELFLGALLRRTIVGVGLASVGMATFWGVHIYGKEVLKNVTVQEVLAAEVVAVAKDRERVLRENATTIKRGEMLGMFLVTVGGGLGLVSFGPLCERLGRRGTFLLFQLLGLGATFGLFGLAHERTVLYALLPMFGYFTLGMHAGFAVYFPELFPTHLRSTGSGFCFNIGRVMAAPVLFLGGWMQRDWGYTLEETALLLSLLFVPGMLLVWLGPETRGRELQG